MKFNLLDHGYASLIENWGSDQSIIEAARMSTNKGFLGWGGEPCSECETAGRISPTDKLFKNYQCRENAKDCVCKGTGKTTGDEKLLAYLYKNKHSTPFEMAGMTIEVKAPIFVFREWHRHRTQSYNEMSARYIPLPDENYVPTVERLMNGANTATTNKQAQGNGKELNNNLAVMWLENLTMLYEHAENTYQQGIELGIPKELARLAVPVARYSRMRASANLRNWLAFLTLRRAPNAQYEIRVYAEAVGKMIADRFPRTWELFNETV